MWDDSTVAWEIRAPWFKRVKWKRNGRYHPSLVTIWHVDPKGDRGWPCGKPDRRRLWRFHVHHWQIQIHPWQHFKRWAFERCQHCKRGYPWGYAPVAHNSGTIHFECHAAIAGKERIGELEHIARAAIHGYCRALDMTPKQAVDALVRADTSDLTKWRRYYTARQLMGVLEPEVQP